VLPKSASGLKIINDSIPNIINLSLESQNVTFKIPICTFNNSAPLNSKYEHYGVKTAFSDTFANFKNVNDSGYLYVEAPSNSSNISLDKFGVTMNQTERFQFNANRNEPLVLREWVYGWEDYSDFSFMDEFISLPIDCYPFIFILRDKLSNRILFLGKITKP
jgi:serine protease inhibitor